MEADCSLEGVVIPLTLIAICLCFLRGAYWNSLPPKKWEHDKTAGVLQKGEQKVIFYKEACIMGTIKPGFWIRRFLITPEEFAVFAKKCHEHRCKFVFAEPCRDRPIISVEKAILQ